ncbi:TraB/GumN family protein [Chitinophaga horti]|uniref:TraB/GumN family protein n=1 Tax=Chitinophaga horti TaxID=2920382 RepID=A0ABY6IY68_9BACT|nr:TraB/GumN family protein [Chitinophaga horti]UYQ91091.1 TraB/GumN family protein [Chitinophaga horti]
MKKLLVIAALLMQAHVIMAQEALLWKVSGKDAKTSYLFASSIVCDNKVQLPVAVETAVTGADNVYFELPDRDDDTAFAGLTRLPAGDSLQRYFSREEYSLFKSFLARRLRIGLAGNEDFTPAFAYYTVRNMLTYCEVNTNYTNVIANLADAQNKPTFGLETTAEGLKAQLKIPPAVYTKLIMDIVYASGNITITRNQQMDLYKKQDIFGMYNAYIKGKELGGYEQIMLGDRNRKWLPVIKTAIARSSSFFCVGALQFGGEQGLIELLRKEGYTVTAIK